MFEGYKGKHVNAKAYEYYHAMFKHELLEFEENFNKWEVNRIY